MQRTKPVTKEEAAAATLSTMRVAEARTSQPGVIKTVADVLHTELSDGQRATLAAALGNSTMLQKFRRMLVEERADG